MRAEDLLAKLNDKPFKPFRVHLSDGTSIDVPDAGMVIVGRSSAVLASRWSMDADGFRIAERFRTISLLHIVQFSDLDESTNGAGPRKDSNK